jgi:alpha-galactosidase
MLRRSSLLITVLAVIALAVAAGSTAAELSAVILTPPAPATPRINGPTIFGVRPGSPFLYTIPVTGDRPITYRVDGLPAGLTLDPAAGRITGRLTERATYAVVLHASNALGADQKRFRIVVGDKIALTPPMGWNSYNCWAESVDQDKIMRSARALVSSGLANHGWTYVNTDDTWQGERGGPHHAILGNEKFPNMKALCDDIHALGLKAGIYSSPWITTYAGFRGGSSDTPDGAWQYLKDYEANKRIGRYEFASNDAAQIAEWGFDYLKYDWNPNDVEHTRQMALALRATGRDIVFSLSNAAPLYAMAELSKWAEAWRTTGDIWDTWETPGPWQNSVSDIGFNQDAWVAHGGPGGWNDPDMLVVGRVGWGPKLHDTKLTPAEQYTHLSLWCLLSAPLLIGCDLEHIDAFTLNLLTNDEVLAINQDPLGISARRIATIGAIDIYSKRLEDGGTALGLFNRGDIAHTITVKLDRIGLGGREFFRDLWRQKDAGIFEQEMTFTVQPHNVMLYKVTPAAEAK